MSSSRLEPHELPFRDDFPGLLIKECGVSEEREPLSRFVDNGTNLQIYVVRDTREVLLGSIDINSVTADICGDGNLYISGPHTSTFVLYL